MPAGLVKVVLVGGTGHFGSRVARALLARPDVSLRLLVRPEKDWDDLGDLMDRGATVVEGSLGDGRSLEAAVEGAHAVVSCVSGGREVVVEGQRRLLQACLSQGVRRFLPSVYGPSPFGVPEGESTLLDLRRQVVEAVERSGVGYTLLLVGGFLEHQLSPAGGMFDFAAGRALRWGTGEELFDVTSMEDAAHLLALVVDDPRAENRRLEFAGDVVNFNGVVAHYEELTGRSLEVVDRGSLEELRRRIHRQRAEGGPVRELVFEELLLTQLSGHAKLQHPANSDYPQVAPLRVRDYLAHHWATQPAPVRPAAEASA